MDQVTDAPARLPDPDQPRPAARQTTAALDPGHANPSQGLGDAARRAAVWGLVLLGIVVLALALWKLRLIVALVFLAIVLAAAMRPGIEALARRRVPRGLGLTLHYAAIVGVFAL